MSTKKVVIYKLLLIFIFSMLISTCFCQAPQIESHEEALKELKKSMSDSNRQYLYNFLGTHYLMNSRYDRKIIDSAFYYLRKAVYLGDSINLLNKQITNESLCLLAQTYLSSGDSSTSKQIYLHVITSCRQHNKKRDEAKTWRRMGNEFMYRKIFTHDIPGYYDSAIVLYGQEKEVVGKAEVMIDKMNFLFEIGNKAAAEKEFQQLTVLSKSNRFEYLSHIYSLLATQNRYRGNLNKGLEYALDAVKYIDQAKNKTIAQYSYGELAQIYEELGETEKSIFWYRKCIAEREKLGAPQYLIYRTMSLMVIQMIKTQREKEAIDLLQQLARRKPPESHLIKAILAQSFGYCYAAMKKYILAEPKFMEMVKEYNYSESQIEDEVLYLSYYDITKFYVDFNQYGKAGFYLKKAAEFDIIGTLSIPRSKDLNFLLFKVDSANKKFASALTHYQKYATLKDSIFNEAKSKQINELMIKYESEKKDNNIKTLEKESIVQNGRLVQANQTRNWMIGVAILLFIITGLFINNSRIRQKANKKLQLQQKEIQSKNISLQHLVKEKDWLVKEIHHRVKNNLHTIIGLLHTQSGYLKTEEALLAINDSQHRIQTMSLIHEKLFQSDNLSIIEMPGYIHELINYLKHSFDTGQRILFKMDTETLEFKLSHALPIGLILNEAITNAIKYAFPENSTGTITVSLKQVTGQQYLLSIVDNGRGLPADFDFEKSSSMGMSLMGGLSEDMHGSFSIKNDNGTTINILFLYDSSVTDNFIIQQDDDSKEII